MDTSNVGLLSYRQGVDAALRVLSGQWEVAVLTALALGPLHNHEVLKAVNAVEEQLGRREHPRPLSQKVLARTLDRMEADDLLLRHDQTVTHPSVSYELTEKGRALLQALRSLAKWAERYQNHSSEHCAG